MNCDGQPGAGEQKLQDASRMVTSNHQQLEKKKEKLRDVETKKADKHKAVSRLLSVRERLLRLPALARPLSACTRPS